MVEKFPKERSMFLFVVVVYIPVVFRSILSEVSNLVQ